ncbi:MAG: FAD-binding oxidoreductase [Candidatus Aenigmarchaeota archaeon]|nr:FAD-binding oxidoreductase [Candidatus Aenigmarchaeota archaeon]
MKQSRIKNYSPWVDGLKSFYSELRQTNPTLPDYAEIAIVGAGPTGLSAAYHLLQSGYDPKKIVVLEKALVGEIPGRSAGIVSIEPEHDCSELRKIYENEKVRKIMDSYKESRTYIEQMIDAAKMDCEFEKRGSLFIGRNNDEEYLTEEAVLRRTYGFDAEFRDIQLSDYTKAIFMPNDYALNPRRFCTELAKYLFSRGVVIIENTEVDDFYEDGKIEIEVIKNKRKNTIYAAKIVLAGQEIPHDFNYERLNRSTNPLLNLLQNILSIETYALTTRQLSESEIKNIGMESGASFIDIKQPFFYGRLTHDNRLLVGGNDLLTILSGLFSRKKIRTLRKKFMHNFQIFNENDIDYEWKGRMRIMLDVFPLVYNQENVYVAGPSAHIQYAVLSGRTAANNIMGIQDDYSELFSDKREINTRIFSTYPDEKISLVLELLGKTERFDD